VSASCEEAGVGIMTGRSGQQGWNSMAAWFRCVQERIGVGRCYGGGERGFGAFYRPAEEGSCLERW
jgi:hypothetical protein